MDSCKQLGVDDLSKVTYCSVETFKFSCRVDVPSLDAEAKCNELCKSRYLQVNTYQGITGNGEIYCTCVKRKRHHG
ncbi:unnamed protein product [Cunninghamella echinulata]